MLAAMAKHTSRRQAPPIRRDWLQRDSGPAGADDILALALAPLQSVARLRWRHDGGLAGDWLALETCCLPLDVLGLPQRFEEDVLDWLQGQGRGPLRVLERWSAHNATPEQACLLGVGPGCALLRRVRHVYDPRGRPLMWGQGMRRGEAQALTLELRRSA